MRRPAAAREVARLTTVVVLPTPPFWLAQAIVRPTQGRLREALTSTHSSIRDPPFPGQKCRPSVPGGTHRALSERFRAAHASFSAGQAFGRFHVKPRRRTARRAPVSRGRSPGGSRYGVNFGREREISTGPSVPLPCRRLAWDTGGGTSPKPIDRRRARSGRSWLARGSDRP